MKKIAASLTSTFLWLSFSGPAASAPVVELFTSQSCYSCPPAEEYLADIIAEQPNVVALEYHVDYWDDLHYGAAGVWKDPFSDPSYTTRQRIYRQANLRGKQGVYTPQMVVNGTDAQVGTSRKAVQRAIDSNIPAINLDAAFADNKLTVDIKDTASDGSILWLAIFDRVQVTDVPRGENHGKTIVNHNVVRELVPLGRWQGDKVAQTFQVATNLHSPENEGSGCAVFLQDDKLGPILGATYCN